MNGVPHAFIKQSRALLTDSYLPRIEKAIADLTIEQTWWRANENSNSIGNLILHLEGNLRQWIVSGIGGAVDVRERQREFDVRDNVSASILLQKLTATVREADQIVAALEPTILLEGRRIQTYDVTVMGAIYSVVEHFSMHTGQIILLAKMWKGDLGLYDLSSGNPRPLWRGGIAGH